MLSLPLVFCLVGTKQYIRKCLPHLVLFNRVTHLVDENLPLTKFGQFWHLVCHFCSPGRLTKCSKFKTTGGFHRRDVSPCTYVKFKNSCLATHDFFFTPPFSYLANANPPTEECHTPSLQLSQLCNLLPVESVDTIDHSWVKLHPFS